MRIPMNDVLEITSVKSHLVITLKDHDKHKLFNTGLCPGIWIPAEEELQITISLERTEPGEDTDWEYYLTIGI